MRGRAQHRRRLALALLALQLTDYACADATADPDNRQRALTLFAEGKRLQALPLLEQIEQKQPRDSEVLVALAAALVDHAATLNDPGATTKERLRARTLLQKAFELGNTSPLEENLRQLLDELPADGTIRFSADPAVQQAMTAGEAAFARHDLDTALREYAQALKLDPTNYYAALFTANTFDRQGNTGKAADWYQRAAAIDPNMETAYRYYADMSAKHGDMLKARSLLIQAAVAEPYNKIVWREIRAWAIINNTAFNLVYLPIPRPHESNASANHHAGITEAWRAYYTVKTRWSHGDAFHKRYPQEPNYRHSLAEESEALKTAAEILERFNKQDEDSRNAVSADPIAPLLLQLYGAGLIDPYVLFSLGDDGIARDYTPYRAQHRDKLEAYLDRFVMPRLGPTASR